MKLLTLCFFLLTAVFATAQTATNISIPYDSASRKYTYSEVITLQNKTPEQLYANAKAWLLKKYATNELSVDDPNAHIIGKGAFEVIHYYKPDKKKSWGVKYTVSFTIDLAFRSDRYRYTLSNLLMTQNMAATTQDMTFETWIGFSDEGNGHTGKVISTMYKATSDSIHQQFLLLIPEMKSGVESGVKDDW